MKLFRNKQKKQIFLSALLIVIIIALYIELNIIVGKAKIPDIDITEEKIFSISDESKNKISKIDKDVNITLVDFTKYDNYAYADDILNLMYEYEKINDKIKIELYEEEIAETTNTYPYIIFKCNDKERIIGIDEMYSYKYNTMYECEEEYYISESAITNSILSVVNDINDKIYIYLEKSAYTEKMFTSIINRINGFGMDTYELVLSEDMNIPNDCRCLIIPPLIQTDEYGNAKVNDLSDEEKDIIVSYINNGGNILFMQESKSIINGETPNLDYIMGLYGVSISDGVIFDSSNTLQNNPGYIYPNINYSNDVYDSLDANSRICMVDSGKINIENDDVMKTLNVSYEILLKASEHAYLRTDITNTSLDRNESDTDAKDAILGIYVEKTINDNKSKAIVYANSVFSLNSAILLNDNVTNKKLAIEMAMLDDNEEIISNSIKYLSDNDDIIYLTKKHYNLVPSSNIITDGITLKIIFTIPLAIIFLGYFVWRYRKNKK